MRLTKIVRKSNRFQRTDWWGRPISGFYIRTTIYMKNIFNGEAKALFTYVKTEIENPIYQYPSPVNCTVGEIERCKIGTVVGHSKKYFITELDKFVDGNTNNRIKII